MNKGKEPPKSKDIELSRSEIEEKLNDTHSEQKIRKYTKGKLLGRGGFARCYEFICQDNNKRFAAKVINKQNLTTERQKQKLRTEIKIHKSLHHNQVVAFEHNFEDNENVYILLEICKNQTLNELLRRRKTLTEIEVQCYVIQLIKGLQYLHSHKIIHRDLKLGNLFLTDKMELKIGDFGLATKLDYDGEKKKTVCGTPNYIAPEVLDGGGHSYEVDIWAIGIIIYLLIVGKAPFETNDIKTTYKCIKGINYKFPENSKISYPAVKLIRRLLVKDPKDRPTFEDILMDDFFNQGTAIPKLLPSASLATPPSLNYIKRFMPNADENGIVHLHEKERIEEEKKRIEKEKEKEKEKNNSNKKNENQNKDNDKNEENNSTKELSNIIEKNENEEKKEKLKGAEIYVTKWVDYSSKYGLGYLLNNGYIGVYFNDCSKILFNPKANDISYVERQTTKEKDMVYSFQLNGAPKELQKKMLIFQNFKKYFEEEIKSDKEKEEKEKEGKVDKEEQLKMCKTTKKKPKKLEKQKTTVKDDDLIKYEEAIYLRKWMKTKQAMIFRLSNKTIQVGFQDHTEVILYNNTISYRNKKGEVSIFKIEDALNSSNFEMNKRIKYTQNILTKMVSINMKKENK